MRILVVANRSVATPALLGEIQRRASAAPCQFVLLVPDAPPGRAGDWLLRHALRLFERAAGAPVEGSLARGRDPFPAVEAALAAGRYDEVILSTLPNWASSWVRQDLPRRVAALGVTVSVVGAAGQRDQPTPV